VGAISMVENDEGFHYPIVDQAKCTVCGSCTKVCPALHSPHTLDRSVDPATWAAWSHNFEDRKNSSSGGVFPVLAKQALHCGGVVFGAGFVDDWKLQHLAVERIEDLYRLQGSKYLQSQIGDAYQKAKVFLGEKRPILFSGTPCQIAGLYGYLGPKEYNGLITCEIICHGVPSPKLFRKYKNEVEQTLEGRIDKINFRDKHLGWRYFSLSFESSSKQKLNNCHRTDDYMRLFLRNICLRKCCSSCEYARSPRVADITLGDYWNITDAHPELPDDDLGVSVVVCNSRNGNYWLEEIKSELFLTPSAFSKAVAGNKNLVTSSVEHKKRTEFFSDIDKKSVASLRVKFCKNKNIGLRVLSKFYRITRKSCSLILSKKWSKILH
jgi:coenzyme F420-reducing hydrogenase beta subunit